MIVSWSSKSHPNYSVREQLKKKSVRNYVVSDDNIPSIDMRADVLVTSYSTTADEAIALNCPAISIDTGALVDMSTFFDIKAAPSVNDPKRIELGFGHGILR